jgi:V/A-type H+-transporting ATPase subunit A
MGYNVAVMADSTSRWAEALREMSGRLEEMPGEEGYPAYLSSRLSEFYERAGIVKVLGGGDKEGSITAIGAVSPAGGDLSDPVAQATLRIVKVFWGLSAQLAYKRHFPAVDWLTSYSLYGDTLSKWYGKHIDPEFSRLQARAMKALQEESEIDEIVRLVGIDSISDHDRLTLDVARMIREDYLHQNAFHETDTFTSLNKQYKMLRLILGYYGLAQDALNKGAFLGDVTRLKSPEKIGRCKYIPEAEIEKFDDILREIGAEIQELTADLGGY